MIHQNMKSENNLCICPECKNTVDLSRYPNLAPGMVIECNHCGMTLLVKEMSGEQVKTEIVDEGK
jgi:DNA-directed RNA polymerase subunit RPC12/RpoP